jgi:hypothetical protein
MPIDKGNSIHRQSNWVWQEPVPVVVALRDSFDWLVAFDQKPFK